MTQDELFMRRAIQLAMNGSGKVAPNPLVGAVIVHNDRIIGEGYHEKFGAAHAEVNAIHRVIDQSLLKDATIYVTLEPCAHFGKTPPCADLICSKLFKRVVIGTLDPNPLVSGKGAESIREAGIETTIGVLEGECKRMNEHFLVAQEKRRPFVLLKWAQSKDGYMDKSGHRAKISNSSSDFLVHQLRHNYQAILVGKNTVVKDNPFLTSRLEGAINPIRILLDSSATLSLDHHTFNDEAQTLAINLIKEEKIKNIQYVQVENMSISEILKKLFELGIISVLVEGGKRVHESFLQSGEWDRALVIQGEHLFECGTEAPVIADLPVHMEKVGCDEHFHFKNT